jgi:Family of unknown function (DUF6256)
VSSSLIRQDLVPMIVGYALIMGALATGLRIVQRSGRAAAGDTAGVSEPARTGKATGTGKVARPGHVAGAAEATGAARASAADGGRPAGPPTSALAGQVTDRERRRSVVRLEPGWRRLAVFSLGTAVGGYLVLMAVIIAYYYGVGVHGSAGTFVPSAFSGCAMLIGLAAPVFFILSWLAERKGWRI